MIRIAFIESHPGEMSPEEKAAWSFLSSSRQYTSKRLPLHRLPGPDALHRAYDVVWWHTDQYALSKEALSEKSLASLHSYVRRGGSLFLSLTAAALVADIGIETSRPNIVATGTWSEESWAKGYPDIRGFAPFQGHPLFAGMTGGPYTWMPTVGRPWSAAVYHDTLPKQGRVVAVERQYIKVIPSRRIITEYSHGKGRILCIGTYLFFEEIAQRVRPHLEQITRNAFSWLTSKRRSERATHWTFDRSAPRDVPRHSRALALRPASPKAPAPPIPSSPEIVRQRAATEPGQPFNVGGQRCVVLGNERNGIEEVWVHPLRTFRSLRTWFSVGDQPPVSADSLPVTISVRPEAVERRFDVHGVRITETTTADPELPAGVLRYSFEGSGSVVITLTGTSDLRLMWPLNEEATGSLTYAWDDGLRAVVTSSLSGEFSAMIGSPVAPESHLVGAWSSVAVRDGRLTGGDASDRTVAFGLSYRRTTGDGPLAIAFAGSGISDRDTERVYRAILRSPDHVFHVASEAATGFFSHSTTLTSPDRAFNEDLAWAQHGVERCFLDTPGLGASYVAGLGTVEKGWNGGHDISGRPGYAWYFGRDSVWTAFAALASGSFERVRSVLAFLGQHQDVTGKIFHELTTSGFAHFDAADSTPLYLILFGRYLRATGHRSFARREFARIRGAVEFCASTDTDKDGLIENTNVGHGWVEGGGLFPVHTEHYLASCWAEALSESAFVATHCGNASLARTWNAASSRVRSTITTDFWNSRTSFFNFAKRADGTYSEEKTILPAVGLSFGIGTPEQADAILRAYASEDFTADWGVRIIGRSNPMFNPAGYHCGSVWPLFTGWAALAEFKHHRPLQGFLHAVSTARTSGIFSAGHVEEVFRGDTLTPAGVCAHQAWSESMVVQPLIEGMLGLEPNGIAHRLKLSPWLPPQWTEFRVERLRVGTSAVTMHIHRSGNTTLADFVLEGWTPVEVTVALRFPLGTAIERIELGRKSLSVGRILHRYQDAPEVSFRLASRMSVVYHHSGGCGVVPPVPSVAAGSESSGIRIIDEHCDGPDYILELEGRAGSRHMLEFIHPLPVIRMDGLTERASTPAGSRATVVFPSGSGWMRHTIRLTTERSF